jgi:hypothetical protein
VLKQFGFLRIGIAAPRLQSFGVVQFPEIVVLQPPERVFGMIRLPSPGELAAAA